jgi:hypothetical protein
VRSVISILRDRAIKIAAGVAALCIIGIVGEYWYANTPPSRPLNVPPDAVFVWAPYVGLPTAPRGTWLSCWFDVSQRVDKCRVSSKTGETQYEGEFAEYPTKRAANPSQLRIDAQKTRESKVWVRSALVPIVYLTDGLVLVPIEAYNEAATTLAGRR